MEAHIPTAFLMIIAVSAALCLSVAAASRDELREGLSPWAKGLALHTGAYVLLALRVRYDNAFNITMSNVLLTASFALFAQALLQFQRKKNHRLIVWLPVVVVGVTFPFLLSDFAARIVVAASALAFQSLFALWLLWRERRTTVGRGQYLMMLGWVGISTMFLARGIATLLGLNQAVAIVMYNPVQVLTFVIGSICLILLTNGFLTMAKERVEAKSNMLAMRDELTGVHNRRSILDILEQRMSIARRNAHPFCILLLDIDHFKRVNDTFGHLTGDHALREIIKNLSGRLRPADAVGRYGGEEFLLVLPDLDEKGGYEVAERIRLGIAEWPLSTPAGEPLPLTVSIGVTSFNARRHIGADILVNEADHALYSAKRRGRNQTAVSDASLPDDS